MTRAASDNTQKTSRKAAFRQQRRKQQQRDRIILISVVSIFALVIAAILIIPNLPANIDHYANPEALNRQMVNGLAVGDPGAPVQVEEYSDFKCVHCAEFWKNQEPQLLSDYINTGKVYFKYVPMSFISAESNAAAEAAYCANDQGKFWEYHDYIFANYGSALTNPLLRAFAQDLKLNMDAFDQCFNQGKHRQQVLDDLDYAMGKGINSTPTFDVNGTIVDRGSLIDQINQALEE